MFLLPLTFKAVQSLRHTSLPGLLSNAAIRWFPVGQGEVQDFPMFWSKIEEEALVPVSPHSWSSLGLLSCRDIAGSCFGKHLWAVLYTAQVVAHCYTWPNLESHLAPAIPKRKGAVSISSLYFKFATVASHCHKQKEGTELLGWALNPQGPQLMGKGLAHQGGHSHAVSLPRQTAWSGQMSSLLYPATRFLHLWNGDNNDQLHCSATKADI